MSYYPQLTLRWREQDRIALTGLGAAISYAELDLRVRRAQSWLHERGLTQGDLVALQLPRGAAFLILHLAALRAGIGTLALNPRAPGPEIRYALEDACPQLAVLLDPTDTSLVGIHSVSSETASHQISEAVACVAPPAQCPDELALLGYTSGTTGRPKGARTLHRHMLACVNALHEAWRWTSDDVLVHALPLFHIHGLVVAQHVAWWANAHTVHLPRFEPAQVLQALERHNATIFMGVPTFYHRLLGCPTKVDLTSMRLFTSGSAPLPAAAHQAFEARFAHRILERYGMTEVGIVLSNPYEGERRAGAVGFPLPGVELRIADPETDIDVPRGTIGQVLIRGPSVFDAYHRRPEATSVALAHGWMHTGDLGYQDTDGYVVLKGRRSDLILCGGFNVYPGEVEAALREHPDVAQAAVIALPDDDLGEIPVVTVVSRSPELNAATVRAHLRQRIAAYKIPRHVRFAQQLPRNAMGKVQKTALRASWQRTPPETAMSDEETGG